MVNRIQKLVCILQLCLSFSLFLWLLCDPYMGNHFRTRHNLLIIENLQGDLALINKSEPLEQQKLEGNRLRWEALSLTTRTSIERAADSLRKTIESPLLDKTLDGAYHLLVKTPFFKLAWVFFAILIPILCLKGKEGAANASLILPLIVVLFAFDMAKQPYTTSSFPTEEEIISEYLKKPLNPSLQIQKEELLHGFDLYLIEKFTKQKPSSNQAIFIEQKNEGEFLFNLADIERKIARNFALENSQEHGLLLMLYFGWNLFFSIVMVKDKLKKKRKESKLGLLLSLLNQERSI